MRKNDVPLVQLAAIEVKLVVRIGPGPDVLAVASIDVVGEKVDAVHALGGQVVQRPDDALAFTVLPGRITRLPVLDPDCFERQPVTRVLTVRILEKWNVESHPDTHPVIFHVIGREQV